LSKLRVFITVVDPEFYPPSLKFIFLIEALRFIPPLPIRWTHGRTKRRAVSLRPSVRPSLRWSTGVWH